MIEPIYPDKNKCNNCKKENKCNITYCMWGNSLGSNDFYEGKEMRKILYIEGVYKDRIYEGTVIQEVDNYIKIRKANDDGSFSFKWFDKSKITILKELGE
jgi:hypothetical protein